MDAIIIFLVIIGLIFLICGLSMKFNIKKLTKKCTMNVVGKVKDARNSVADLSNLDDVSYLKVQYPVFEYSVDGINYEKYSNIGSPRETYTVGQDITIFYNPQNPDEYYDVKGNATKRILGNVFTIVGIVLVLIGIIIKVVELQF